MYVRLVDIYYIQTSIYYYDYYREKVSSGASILALRVHSNITNNLTVHWEKIRRSKEEKTTTLEGAAEIKHSIRIVRGPLTYSSRVYRSDKLWPGRNDKGIFTLLTFCN